MIYILRHGEAAPDRGTGDADRPLTELGRRQARTAGRAMRDLGLRPDCCLASPKLRARDTAELACHELGLAVEICPPLAAGGFDSLELVAGRGTVLLVGHQPFLAQEVTRLTGANLALKKGGLVAVEPSRLHRLLTPKDLAAIAAASG